MDFSNCHPPTFPQLLIGLLGVSIVLLLFNSYAPEYTTLYIVVVILGLTLAHADCVRAFVAQLQMQASTP